MSKHSRNTINLSLAFVALTSASPCETIHAAAPDAQSRPRAEVAQFREDLGAFIDELRANEFSPPGFAVVVLHGGDVVFERAYGVRDTSTGRALTLDTPIYNASTTKAYTGLLAAILHQEGTLRLDATMKDVWPQMPRVAAFDPAQIQASALLSHSAPINEGGMDFRTNITGQITTANIPRQLTMYAVARPAGFHYSNFGPSVWGAMAEAKTGSSWRDGIQRKVFEPLRLTHTATRVEQFPGGELAHCHAPIDGRWQPVELKPTALLNPAGGIYSSARDTGEFVKAFLTDGQSARGRISAAALRLSWQRQVEQDRDVLGMHRDGYGLGWDLGSINGHRFVARSGGITGCRSIILFLPEESLGLVVLSLGDAGANGFNSAILSQAIDLWSHAPDAQELGQKRIAAQADAPVELMKLVQAVEARVRAAPKPAQAQLRAAVGCYENTRLGRFELIAKDGELQATGGAFTGGVHLVEGDNFFMATRGSELTDTFRLIRDSTGQVTAFLWDDDQYERCAVDAASTAG